MPTKSKATKAVEAPERRILVEKGDKAFVITVPPDAKTTFGPWVPPAMRSRDKYGGFSGGPGDSMGTLRVYGRTEKHILGVFSGVTGFRDLSLGYSEVDPELFSYTMPESEDETEDKEETEEAYAEDVILTHTVKKGPLPVFRGGKIVWPELPSERIPDSDEEDPIF